VGQRKLEGLAERKRGREEEISGTMVVERKERGFVTLCDKSVLLHKDFVLSSFLGLRPPPSAEHQLCHGKNFNVADENRYERAVLTDVTADPIQDCDHTATLKQSVIFIPRIVHTTAEYVFSKPKS